ncbi:MAG TPA: GTP cyclohydrolase II, partial [Gammaproteobacteria bacterium]|nr:GTP cyclohydrolase II [Gammaproteobacteria bacterium]
RKAAELMDLPKGGINGHASALTTERAVEELRRGRAIQLSDRGRYFLVTAIESLEAPLLERLQHVDGAEPLLVVTAQRARSAGLAVEPPGPVGIAVPPHASLETLRSLAGLAPQVPAPVRLPAIARIESPVVEASFRLTKLGRLVPALLILEGAQVADPGLLTVDIQDLARESRSAQGDVELVSRARVPLVDALDSEIVLFRRRGDLDEHLAIVIGRPERLGDVPVRLHSACLTGDVLGSLRCDCGDQLKRAIGRIASLGGGVLLYLDQEGRGIGLANKLRAYALQDGGLDTVDADQHLGFSPDERDYAVAAAALRALGVHRVRLLTNNPAKIRALEQHGIDVTGRLPLVAAVNDYNQRYLKAKYDRAGHLTE